METTWEGKRCRIRGCEFYGSPTSCYCSYHSDANRYPLFLRLREADLSLRKDAGSPEPPVCSTRREPKLVLPPLELVEQHPPPSPRECFTIEPSRPGTVKRRCLLCNIPAEKSHVTSKGHRANVQRYIDFVRIENLERSEGALGAYLGSTASLRNRYKVHYGTSSHSACTTTGVRPAQVFQAIPTMSVQKPVVKIGISHRARRNWQRLMSRCVEVEALLQASVVPYR